MTYVMWCFIVGVVGNDGNRSKSAKGRDKLGGAKVDTECHLAINDDNVVADAPGFLISFRLSRAYRAIERQEVSVSKPTLKPFVLRRRRRPQAVQLPDPVVSVAKPASRQKTKTKKSFWKQMIDIKVTPPSPRPSKRSGGAGRRKRSSSRERARRKSVAPPDGGGAKQTRDSESLAAQEWERRNDVRRRTKLDRQHQLKVTSRRKRRNSVRPMAEGGDQVKGTARTTPSPRRPSPARHVTAGAAAAAAAAAAAGGGLRATGTSADVNATKGKRRASRSGESLASTASDDDAPSATRRESFVSWDLHSSSSASASNLLPPGHARLGRGPASSSGSTRSDDRTSWGAETTAAATTTDPVTLPGSTVPAVTSPAHVPTRYALELSHAKPLIPRPSPGDVTGVTRPAASPKSARTDEPSDAGRDRTDDKKYATARYLYSMCHCHKVGHPRTINKLLRLRKVRSASTDHAQPIIYGKVDFYRLLLFVSVHGKKPDYKLILIN